MNLIIKILKVLFLDRYLDKLPTNGQAFLRCLTTYSLFIFTSAKKKNKKGKTLTLTDFLAEDKGSSNAPPSYPAKSTSWADETDDLDGDGEHTPKCTQDIFILQTLDLSSIFPSKKKRSISECSQWMWCAVAEHLMVFTFQLLLCYRAIGNGNAQASWRIL